MQRPGARRTRGRSCRVRRGLRFRRAVVQTVMATDSKPTVATPSVPVSTGRLIPWSTEEDELLRQVRRLALRGARLQNAQPYSAGRDRRVLPSCAQQLVSATLARQLRAPAATLARREGCSGS